MDSTHRGSSSDMDSTHEGSCAAQSMLVIVAAPAETWTPSACSRDSNSSTSNSNRSTSRRRRSAPPSAWSSNAQLPFAGCHGLWRSMPSPGSQPSLHPLPSPEQRAATLLLLRSISCAGSLLTRACSDVTAESSPTRHAGTGGHAPTEGACPPSPPPTPQQPYQQCHRRQLSASDASSGTFDCGPQLPAGQPAACMPRDIATQRSVCSSARLPVRRPLQVVVDLCLLEEGEWSSHGCWRRLQDPNAAAAAGRCSSSTSGDVVAVPPELQQIPSSALVKGRELGRGHFGRVWHATLADPRKQSTEQPPACRTSSSSSSSSSSSNSNSTTSASSSSVGGTMSGEGMAVAVKELMPRGGSGLTSTDADAGCSPQELLAEAQRLHELRHAHVVSLLGVVAEQETGTYTLVTEYMASGCLKGALRRVHARCGGHAAQGVSLRWKAAVARAAALGMAHLHACDVVHFDLKPENLLCDLESDPENPVVKVGDLGLSQKGNGRGQYAAGHMRGTLPYMAPELLGSCSGGEGSAAAAESEGLVTGAVDVYSFGVCMLEIWTLCSHGVYEGMDSSDVMAGLLTGSLRPEVPTGMEPAWAGLMQRCWAACPSARPNFEQVARELGEIMQQQP